MTIDWDHMRALMLKSFTGGTLTDDEQKIIEDAYKQDPEKYGKENKEVKQEKIKRLKEMFYYVKA